MIHAVILQEGTHLVAQCLEYDIAAQGKDAEELRRNLQATLLAHIEVARSKGEKPFRRLKQAPKHYWELYDGSRKMKQKLYADCEDVELGVNFQER